MALFQRRGDVLLQRCQGIAVLGGIQRAGQLEDGVQVGLGAHAEFLGDLAKGLQVSADQFAVHGESRAAACAPGRA